MQYYNKFLKNDGITDEQVVCLNRVLTICTEKANMLFSCKVDFICPVELIYVSKSTLAVLEEYCTLLERYCLSHRELTATLEKDISGNTAKLTIADNNGTQLDKLNFELYTGIPGLVIRTPEGDSLICKYVEEIFAKLKYIKCRNY